MAHDLDGEEAVRGVGAPRWWRVRAAASVPRELIRIVYRDPEHVCERMTLFACDRLAEPTCEWVQRTREADPQADRREIADALGVQSARIARIEGAVAGTPFYLALVPGYMNYLWQEVRMTLRLAALYGRDPAALSTAAEVLALRGVYPSIQTAQTGLLAVQASRQPSHPVKRRSLRLWIRSARRLLVFGGFLSPPRGIPRHGWLSWLRDGIGLVATVGIWVATWIFPATFMIAMAWGCHTHARRLFRTALDHYSGEKAPSRTARERANALRHHSKREVLHGAALSFSILLPIGFLVYATRVRDRVGLNPISALGLLVAVSLVIAASVYGHHR